LQQNKGLKQPMASFEAAQEKNNKGRGGHVRHLKNEIIESVIQNGEFNLHPNPASHGHSPATSNEA